MMLLLVDIVIFIFGLPLIIPGSKIASKFILTYASTSTVFPVLINAVSKTFTKII